MSSFFSERSPALSKMFGMGQAVAGAINDFVEAAPEGTFSSALLAYGESRFSERHYTRGQHVNVPRG